MDSKQIPKSKGVKKTAVDNEQDLDKFVVMVVAIELAYCSKHLDDDVVLAYLLRELLRDKKIFTLKEADRRVVELIFRDMFRLIHGGMGIAVYNRGIQVKRVKREITVMWT